MRDMTASPATEAPRRLTYMPLADIKGAARNPKDHDSAGITASIQAAGFTAPLIYDERTGRLVAGHGRLAALTQLHAAGAPPPDGIDTGAGGEWLVPVVRGWASESESEAEAVIVADNKLTERGGWDDAVLTDVLRDLFGYEPDLMAITGYTAGDLDDLLASLEDAAEAATPAHPATPAEFTPPVTDAHYAETPEQEAARGEKLATQRPQTAQGLAEVILVYTEEDRAELSRLVMAARAVLHGDLRTSDIVLRAMRLMMTVLDARDDPGPVHLGAVARAAGWDPEPNA